MVTSFQIPSSEFEAAVDEMYATLSVPIRHASLFYSLYWLTEIEGEPAASFDFMQLRTRLYESFQLYGLYSVARELSNSDTHFRINEQQIQTHRLVASGGIEADPDNSPAGRDVVEAYVREQVDPADRDLAFELLWSSHRIPAQPQNATLDDIEGLLVDAEHTWNALSEPEAFLRVASELFALSSGSAHPANGWERAFGGPAWQGIAKHLLRADELTEVAWINQSWAIAHNNANWLDKLEVPTKERELVGEVYSVTNPDATGTIPISLPRYFNGVLTQLLDQRKAGNMEYVFIHALEFVDPVHDLDIDLEVNLQRLIARHGYTRDYLESLFEPVEFEFTPTQAAAAATILNALRAGLVPPAVVDVSALPISRDEVLNLKRLEGRIQQLGGGDALTLRLSHGKLRLLQRGLRAGFALLARADPEESAELESSDVDAARQVLERIDGVLEHRAPALAAR